VRKKTWKTRSRDSGPKYKKVVSRRQYYYTVSWNPIDWTDRRYLILDEDGSEAVE